MNSGIRMSTIEKEGVAAMISDVSLSSALKEDTSQNYILLRKHISSLLAAKLLLLIF